MRLSLEDCEYDAIMSPPNLRLSGARICYFGLNRTASAAFSFISCLHSFIARLIRFSSSESQQ
jgi:hypothetical protein